jgi:phosphocarrier protein
MLRQKITIINKLGLHARAAAKFVSCASTFSSTIQVGQAGKLVDGKSIM